VYRREEIQWFIEENIRMTVLKALNFANDVTL
jgi:hypothetical protein